MKNKETKFEFENKNLPPPSPKKYIRIKIVIFVLIKTYINIRILFIFEMYFVAIVWQLVVINNSLLINWNCILWFFLLRAKQRWVLNN